MSDALEDARLAFEIHHEMTYHEMCAVLTGLRADVAVLRAALKREYRRHDRAVTLNNKPIQFCACCDHKSFPCAAREEIRAALAPSTEGEN